MRYISLRRYKDANRPKDDGTGSAAADIGPVATGDEAGDQTDGDARTELRSWHARADAAASNAALLAADDSADDNLDYLGNQPTNARPDKRQVALMLMGEPEQVSAVPGQAPRGQGKAHAATRRAGAAQTTDDCPTEPGTDPGGNDFLDAQTTAARPTLLPKVEFHYHEDEPAQDEPAADADEDALWASHMASADPGAPSESERLTQLMTLLELVQTGLPRQTQELAQLGQDVGSAAAMLGRLVGLAEGSHEREQLTATLGRQLGRMEAALVELERRTSLSWLRQRLDDPAVGEATIVHYVRLQFQHLASTPECWIRIDMATTRLARERDPDGGPSLGPLASIDKVAPLWSACLPACEAEPRVRKKAKVYFVGVIGRLRGLERAAELFRGGVYADIIGYKLSLGTAFFDPRILYAAARLNIAIQTWLQGRKMPSASELDEWLGTAHDNVRTLLREHPQDDTALEAVRARMRARRKHRPGTERLAPRTAAWPRKKPTARSLLGRLLMPLALVVIAVLGAPMIMSLYGEQTRDLEPIAAAELKKLHPILASGSYGGDPRAILIGKLAPEEWSKRDAGQRRDAVEALLDQLSQRGIAEVLLYDDGVLAVNVVAGEILYLQ